MNAYLSGNELYGDNFSLDEIKKWFEEESEGYANLGSNRVDSYRYGYHHLNKIHGYSKIKHISGFGNVLGIGSAWGHEFEPIIDKIRNITIIEPSTQLISNKIGTVAPVYVKPGIDGKLPFDDGSFDLITCFGTLHHIPNVSFVLSEMVRTLKPRGIILLREPVISMGDWTNPRNGLTKNERGIPDLFFETFFKKQPVRIISKKYCFTMTAFFQRTIGKLLSKPLHYYKTYITIDKILSYLLKTNVHYHATNMKERIAPTSIFYVIEKI
ncbi:MAG: class I SAM-dependent methyltransferase [Breznakibacter sp.]